MRDTRFDILLLLPLAIFVLAFLALPLARLTVAAGDGESGLMAFLAILTEARYRTSLIATLLLAILTTAVTLALATVAAQTLANRHFSGRPLLLSLLTFPLAFPGVVVGFLVILLGGRLGLVGSVTKAVTGTNVVFAYSLVGLFLG